MSEDRTIHVGEHVADGEPFEFPIIDILTGRGFTTGKSGSGKSILEGTPVYTENGRKPIEEVEEGERVLSLNKRSYEQEFREVYATIEHQASDLVRITLEDGTELVGTEDHSFLTVEDMEIVPVQGSDVEEGTWMPLSRRLPSSETISEIDLAEYASEVNNIAVREETIQSGPRTDDRYLSFDFETGKVVGLYLAEGSFDSGLTLQISNVDDGVKDFLGEQGFNVYEKSCNKGFRPFALFLKDEFGTGSAGKCLPGWVFDTPADFRAGLLSGYFDGDGTINENSATAISKSLPLLEGMKELLRQFGISATLKEKFTVYAGEERQYTRLTVDSFCLDTFADVVDLSVEDKSAQLTRTAETLADGGTYNSKDMIPEFGPVLNAAAREQGWTTRASDERVAGASVHHLTRQQKAGRRTYNRLVGELEIDGRAKAYGESDIQWTRVVDVEPIEDTRTVYDLDVAVNDNFIANGVFVHNSNTVSVVAEQLLEQQLPVMIIDIEGEYYGLKEEYELLHAGADEECDIQVSPEHAEKLANLALEENVPIILDISGYLDEDIADELILETVRYLFTKEKKLKKPFLLVVEECHEYLPEGGGMDETGKMLIKVAKRGRKHGLGIVGISQRPADVKKDFITQANWLVWHRLTWENDTKVVSRIVGSEYGNKVADLDAGEAFVQADWTDNDVERVQFKRKRTFDAGATPGLDDFERPELKSVSDALVDDLSEITEQQQQEQNRIAELEEELGKKEKRIRDLERELENAQNVSKAARQMANALSNESYQAKLSDATGGDGDVRDEQLARLQERIDELESRLAAETGDAADETSGDTAESTIDSATTESTTDASDADTVDSDSATTERDESSGSETAFDWGPDADLPDDEVEAELERLRRKGERLRREEEREAVTESTTSESSMGPEELMDYLHAVPVVTRINAARRDSLCNDAHAWRVVAALATTAPITAHDLAEHVDLSIEPVQSLLAELRSRDLVNRDGDRRYTFDVDRLAHLVKHADEKDALGELREQWEV